MKLTLPAINAESWVCCVFVYDEAGGNILNHGLFDAPPNTGWNVHPMCREMWHLVVPAPEDVTPQAVDGLQEEDAAGAVVQFVDNVLRGRAKAVPPPSMQDVSVGCLESSR